MVRSIALAGGAGRDGGHAAQQGLRDGVVRSPLQLLGATAFYHFARVQHQHVVAQVANHRQVVANEQIGQAQLLLQLQQHIEHLGLHRNVQGADRLIQHQQARAR